MIIYAHEKYACASCIRGHRSSTCKHTERMLVKVRTRGRPSPSAIRDVIMVDKEDEDDSSSPSMSPGSCAKNMERQPILFVKIKHAEKARMIDGKLQILINGKGDDTESNNFNEEKDSHLEDGKKFISETEFLQKISKKPEGNTSSCPSSSIRSENQQLKSTSLSPPMSTCCGSSASIGTGVDSKLNSVTSWTSNDLSTPTTTSSESFNDLKPNTTAASLINDSHHPLKLEGSTLDDLLEENQNTNNNKRPCTMRNKNNSNDNNINIMNDETVDLFTHEGIFLSSNCSCPDDNCQCLNCLIHRNEEELNSYIINSGVPLKNVGEAKMKDQLMDCSTADCKCTAIDCLCDDCFIHPIEIVSFEKLLINGLLHFTFTRKTMIKYKGKFIPSQYWWDFIVGKLLHMSEQELESIDILGWFDNIIAKYNTELIEVNDFEKLNLQGLYVI
ncbi:Mac1p NDAI_0C06080 [Naumovozyma dairenensis CBS 421]|uniref:Copper-fist domain-containing protein n=1 Tax=Naumovozyma dairenensis (strain ATCC 10597 / BCRC 20456 / CBS 421 / NBRC 0211 / NRRL Y-12639) TaxID=1071378 RepID=G0W906_NAUDC|nr:hypothetical protein NDAI_0C06080 [Naumovozyma dairenensis CBS 421]CCD24267.1 hypothetical protein NDAI_0C06080 [Naumovozyma dairenensis CBS 421]